MEAKSWEEIGRIASLLDHAFGTYVKVCRAIFLEEFRKTVQFARGSARGIETEETSNRFAGGLARRMVYSDYQTPSNTAQTCQHHHRNCYRS